MKVQEYVGDFVENTTFHGYRYVFGQHRNVFRRFVWFLFLAACTLLLVFQVSDRIQHYYKWPTMVDIRMISNLTMIFPAVTICNLNTFRITKAESYSYLAAIDFLTGGSLGMSSVHVKRAVYAILHREPSTVTMEELLINAGHDKTNFIVQCKWLGSPCSHDNFSMILTKSGVCYTFNGDLNTFLFTSSPGKGLELVLNVETYQYMIGDNAGAGIRLLAHDKNVYPSVYELGHEISTDTDTRIDIQFTDVQTMETPYGDCGRLELKYLNSTYTITACKMECLSDHIFYSCGCKDAYMPGPFPVCFVIDMLCVHDALGNLSVVDLTCNCPPPCRESRYEPTFSYASLSDFAIDQMRNKLNIEEIQKTSLAAIIAYNIIEDRSQGLRNLDHYLRRLSKNSFYDQGISTLNKIENETITTEEVFKTTCSVENPVNWLQVAERLSVQLQNHVISPFLFEFANVGPIISICIELDKTIVQMQGSISENQNRNVTFGIIDTFIEHILDISRNYSMIAKIFNDAITDHIPSLPNFTEDFRNFHKSLIQLKNTFEKPENKQRIIQEAGEFAYRILQDVERARNILHNDIVEARASTIGKECEAVTVKREQISKLISNSRNELTSLMERADEALENVKTMRLTAESTMDNFDAIDLFLDNAKDEIVFNRLYSSVDYWSNMLNISISEFLQIGLKISKNVVTQFDNETRQQMFKSLHNMNDHFLRNVGSFRRIYHTWVMGLGELRKKTKTDESFYRKNFIHLRLAFHDMSFKRIVQKDSYGIFALLSDIGGSMGLLIGGSVVSTFEIIDFIFVIMMLYVSGKMQPQKHMIDSGISDDETHQLNAIPQTANVGKYSVSVLSN